jgi:hypothetical protein
MRYLCARALVRSSNGERGDAFRSAGNAFFSWAYVRRGLTGEGAVSSRCRGQAAAIGSPPDLSSNQLRPPDGPDALLHRSVFASCKDRLAPLPQGVLLDLCKTPIPRRMVPVTPWFSLAQAGRKKRPSANGGPEQVRTGGKEPSPRGKGHPIPWSKSSTTFRMLCGSVVFKSRPARRLFQRIEIGDDILPVAAARKVDEHLCPVHESRGALEEFVERSVVPGDIRVLHGG